MTPKCGTKYIILLYNFSVGAPYLVAKMVSKLTPTLEIQHEGDHVNIRTKTMMTNKLEEYKIGEEKEQTMYGGGKFKVVQNLRTFIFY